MAASKKKRSKMRKPEPPSSKREQSGGKTKKPAHARANSSLPVLHEDAHMIAIKPAGWCAVRAGFWERGTVVHALEGRERLQDTRR